MKDHYERLWHVGFLGFCLSTGNLLNAPVDAIVSSEQSDFVLSGNPKTISGQIRARYGDQIQDQLVALTGGQTKTVGTVLKTTGGSDYTYIYHAGFHDPSVWLEETDEDSQSEHVEVVRRCVRQVLDDLRVSQIHSVAIPLIGCGIFGLDPWLVAYQYVDEILRVASSPDVRGKAVWLVVRDERQFQQALNAIVQALFQVATIPQQYEPIRLGVSYLDLFEQDQLARASDPRWLAWLLARYCELVAGFLFFHLTRAVDPTPTPRTIMQSGHPLTFGKIRYQLIQVEALLARERISGWTRLFSSLVHEDAEGAKVLEKINEDRNAIAHGRQSRAAEEIGKNLRQFIQLPRWRELEKLAGPPNVNGLEPWVVRPVPSAETPSNRRGDVGVFESWRSCWRSYVVPYTGQGFVLSSDDQAPAQES